MRLQFLGAARQVTGSQYYFENNGSRALVDCGMYQERAFLERNWEPFAFPPRRLKAVLISHAHVDHCGLLPKLVRDGFDGVVYATAATADLMSVVLHDSAKIQSEDVEFKKKRHRKEGRTGRFPVQPLFTEKDVARTLRHVSAVEYGQTIAVADGMEAVFHDAGHILGSAMIDLRFQADGGTRRIIFSGDIGQWDRPIIRDPSVFTEADYVVMESTYGVRAHGQHEDVGEHLARVITETIDAGGNVVIPTFAIERAQELIYHLGKLIAEKKIPALPVFLDSPMATEVTDVFRRHADCYDADTRERMASGDSPLRFPSLQLVSSAEESKEINDLRTPAVIMATSGMCTAGRIKHHLIHNLSRPESTILFVGYQAEGTLGRQILNRPRDVRVHGRLWPVRARVERIEGFSGHADGPTLLRWLGHFQNAPRQIFLTHGEKEAALALADQIRQQPGWSVTVPEFQQTVTLT